MSNNNHIDHDFLLKKVVKIHNLSVRPDLNGKVGTVISYLPDKMRYLVKLSNPHPSVIVNAARSGTNISPISLRRDSLIPATVVDRMKCKVFGVREMVTFVLTDATVRNELRYVYGSVMQRLPRNSYYILPALITILFLSMYLIGFSKTLIAFSLLVMIPALSLNDIVAGSNLRTIVKNYPYRVKETISRCTGYTRVTTRMAMSIFFIVMLLSVSLLFGPNVTSRPKVLRYEYPRDTMHDPDNSLNQNSLGYKLPDEGSGSHEFKPIVIDTNETPGSQRTIKDIYKLGYTDGIQNNDYGASLPDINNDVLTIHEPPRQAPHNRFDSDHNYGYSHDSTYHKKKNKIGFGTLLSFLALGRIIKDTGFTSNGNFDFNYFIFNLKNMKPWKMGLGIFMVYNLLKIFIY